MTVWLSVSLAIVAAAPYLAAFMVVAVLMFLLSKGNKKDPPTI